MTDTNELNSFRCTMRWEGRAKKSMLRSDPGNWTGGRVGVGELIGSKFGVSAPTLRREYPHLTMDEVTEAIALTLHNKNYWIPSQAGKYPDGVDHALADDAYNAGVGAAVSRARAVSLFARAKPDPIGAIHAYTNKRLAFLQSLRIWSTYGRGWGARVAGVEVEAIKMAHHAVSNDVTHPAYAALQSLPDTFQHSAAMADEQTKRASGRAAAAATVTASTAPASAAMAPTWLADLAHHPIVIVAVMLAALALLLLVVYHRRIGTIRSAALLAAAKE